MMNKEHQKFTKWMEKHQNKIVFGVMYDGENYRWNSYIPENATKNYLLDMKNCLIDNIKLIDDVFKIDDDIHSDVEKDVTDFMEKKGVKHRSAQGGGKLIKYYMATAHYIFDDTQKKQNSTYVRDVLKNAIWNDNEIDRIDEFDIISGSYRFLFDMIKNYEDGCEVLPQVEGENLKQSKDDVMFA